jgi:hypothetical protein
LFLTPSGLDYKMLRILEETQFSERLNHAKKNSDTITTYQM